MREIEYRVLQMRLQLLNTFLLFLAVLLLSYLVAKEWLDTESRGSSTQQMQQNMNVSPGNQVQSSGGNNVSPPGFSSQTSNMTPSQNETPRRSNTEFSNPAEGTLNTVEGYLLSTLAPLNAAARDYGLDPESVLPSDDQLRAAMASQQIDSAESEVVIATLRESYARFGMPFPEPIATANESHFGVEGRTDGTDAVVYAAFLKVAVERFKRGAEAGGLDPTPFLPSNGELADASATGDPESGPSRTVLTRLRNGYEVVGLPFPEMTAGSTSR